MFRAGRLKTRRAFCFSGVRRIRREFPVDFRLFGVSGGMSRYLVLSGVLLRSKGGFPPLMPSRQRLGPAPRHG